MKGTFLVFLLTAVSALANPQVRFAADVITENPFDYFDKALSEIRNILPNAEFYSVESRYLEPSLSYCTFEAWTFTFIDKVLDKIGTVEVKNHQVAIPRTPWYCYRGYHASTYDYPSEEWAAYFAANNIKDYDKISLSRAKEWARIALGNSFAITSLSINFRMPNSLTLILDGELNDHKASAILINLTSGEVKILEL